MFPQITLSFSGLYAVINTLNLGARISLILSYMIFFAIHYLGPDCIFQELPTEIMQSAWVDSATPFQTFYKIFVASYSPALVTAGLLAFIAAWNEYIFALAFTTIAPEARTIPVAISLFTGSVSRQVRLGDHGWRSDCNDSCSGSEIFIFQRRIVQGLTAGAVKG